MEEIPVTHDQLVGLHIRLEATVEKLGERMLELLAVVSKHEERITRVEGKQQ